MKNEILANDIDRYPLTHTLLCGLGLERKKE